MEEKKIKMPKEAANVEIAELKKKAEELLEKAKEKTERGSEIRELSDEEAEQVVGGMLEGPEFRRPAQYRAFFCPKCGDKAVYFLGDVEYLEESGCVYFCKKCRRVYEVSIDKATGKTMAMTEDRQIIEIKESVHGGEPISYEEMKRWGWV